VQLGLLFADELRGFYKSKVMIFLWVGLPLMAVLFRFISVETSGQDIPFTLVSTIVVSSLAGTLAAVMLAVFIINEKNRRVYDLFLIRPLKRRHIIMAKFLAVYLCVAIASFISVVTGIVVDYATTGSLSAAVLTDAGTSLVTSLSMIAVSCSAGILIGVVSPTVLVGSILVIYGGNQVSIIPLVPALLNLPEATVFTIFLAGTVAGCLLAGAVALFNRQQF
jgi:ABC-2 type transport system permease protein